jgi:sugar lactone lactonase YvrE
MFIKAVSAILAFIIGYLLFWPTAIDPISWAPLDSVQVGQILEFKNIKRIEIKSGIGPEDIAIDSSGHIYGGLKSGAIFRLDNVEAVWSETGGRPLGLHFHRDNLIVADGVKGLLSINPEGKVVTLTTEHDNLPFAFTDDLDIASDGTIYFSDASSKYGPSQALYDFIESRPHGRLLKYNPQTKETTLLLKDLHFANGIALSEDEDFVLVVESSRYKITRHWLKGETKGFTEPFIERLPAIPDGISRASDGGFWVAFMSPRSKILEVLSDKPFLRKILGRIPYSLLKGSKKFSMFMKLDSDGLIEGLWHDPSGEVLTNISSVQEHNGTLYLGSFKDSAFARWALPEKFHSTSR